MKSATEDSPDMPAAGRRWYQRYRTHDDHTALQLAIQTICYPNYQPPQHTTTHHPAKRRPSRDADRAGRPPESGVTGAAGHAAQADQRSGYVPVMVI